MLLYIVILVVSALVGFDLKSARFPLEAVLLAMLFVLGLLLWQADHNFIGIYVPSFLSFALILFLDAALGFVVGLLFGLARKPPAKVEQVEQKKTVDHPHHHP